MGLALLVIIWLITFFSTYFFAAQTWWLPHGVSTAAPWIDHQFALTYVLMGIVFVAAQAAGHHNFFEILDHVQDFRQGF